ncbi:MAG: hypothetical protein FD181_2677 [Prolixibacteraceae bacterium]|nr:MAG: hypothetical protein FD181_2677 [Prolixibacteraceae bacterium]
MEKSELLSALKETLKSDPNFKGELIAEISKIYDRDVEKEIDNWVANTKNKTY